MMWLQRCGDNYIDGAEIELPQSITGEFNVCWHVFLFPSFFKIGLPVLVGHGTPSSPSKLLPFDFIV